MQYAYVMHDTPERQAVTMAGLSEARFDTYLFASADALFDAARAVPPDLVVAPLGHPELSGSDLVLALRSDPRTCRVPVLLVGEGSAEAVGANAHLLTVVTPAGVCAASILGQRLGSQPELELTAPALPVGRSQDIGAEDAAPPTVATQDIPVDAVLRRVERSLTEVPGLTISIKSSLGDALAAIDSDELGSSIDALARNLAQTCGGAREIAISSSICSFGREASAVGLAAGTYVAIVVECAWAGRGDTVGGCAEKIDPGVGLVVARDAVARAGGTITLARRAPVAAAFTAYVPAAEITLEGRRGELVGTAA